MIEDGTDKLVIFSSHRGRELRRRSSEENFATKMGLAIFDQKIHYRVQPHVKNQIIVVCPVSCKNFPGLNAREDS